MMDFDPAKIAASTFGDGSRPKEPPACHARQVRPRPPRLRDRPILSDFGQVLDRNAQGW